jgi:hypothetical protein
VLGADFPASHRPAFRRVTAATLQFEENPVAVEKPEQQPFGSNDPDRTFSGEHQTRTHLEARRSPAH